MKLTNQNKKLLLYFAYAVSLFSYGALFIAPNKFFLTIAVLAHPILLATLLFPTLENTIFIKLKDSLYWQSGSRYGLAGFIFYILILTILLLQTFLMIAIIGDTIPL